MSANVGQPSGNASLYQREEKIHPREVDGRFDRLRKLAMLVLLGIFYVGPWLMYDGRQAVLFDLPARKFYLFGLTFWPQDFVYLALLLIIAAISLFFFTALAGRLWCGYACPQTVWTEAFALIERVFEGRRAQRIKLDKAPWTGNKFARKTGKQFAWIALALFTGFCFVAYFVPVGELARQVATLELGGWALFWVLFYGFATYGNAAYMREQVCKYMCPYARFQSAMFDKDSLIITYDTERGEPRGSRSRKADRQSLALGDCIDCTLCVQACPTGIDIRDGLQYECIACAACIDACDDVMDKMNYPRGLIRYSTENAMNGKQTRVLRPRVLIYAVLLSVLFGAFITSMATSVPLLVDVIRDRNSLYRDAGIDGIENTYLLNIINKERRSHRYTISVAGIEAARLTSNSEIDIPAESLASVPVAVIVPHEYAKGGQSIMFHVQAVDAPAIQREEISRFRGPVPR
ncbi:MAG: cytochrome c oxidase accessory protein CcoG [Pseudomonadota bacterium]